MNETAEIRALVVTLASGLPPRPGCCGEWTDAHMKAVRSHHLGPWLYARLQDRDEAGLSAQYRRALEKDYGLSFIVSRLRAQFLRNVLEALERAGIPVVVLKGAYLAQSVYDDPGLRIMSDVDLLTQQDDFEKASFELTKLGYVVTAEALYKDEILSPPAMAYMKPNQPINCVDLHRALWGIDYYRLDSSIMWNHAVETRLHGHRVYFLSPELNFIHIALHTLNHSNLLRDWLDLVLLSKVTPLDWDRLIDLAQDLRVVRPLFWAFEELRNLWALVVPRRVTDRLNSYKPHWLEDRVISGRLRYGWRLYAKLHLIKGWGPRLMYVRSKVFPSADYREAFSGDRRWLSYWGAVLRHVAHRMTVR